MTSSPRSTPRPGRTRPSPTLTVVVAGLVAAVVLTAVVGVHLHHSGSPRGAAACWAGTGVAAYALARLGWLRRILRAARSLTPDAED